MVRLQEIINFLRPIDAGYELIRLGNPDGDGGYLVPDDLDGISHCFSPGVDKMADFEKDMIKRGIACYLADGTVDAPPVQDEMINFTQKNLGSEDTSPKETELSSSPPTMRLDTWMKESPYTGDLILQMDIEGHEYEVLNSVQNEILRKFRIIVIELHGMGDLVRRKRRSKDRIIYEVLRKLSTDFSVVHVHPNSVAAIKLWENYEIPGLLEITFLRKDRIHNPKPIKKLPHPLDRPNMPGHPEISLDKFL